MDDLRMTRSLKFWMFAHPASQLNVWEPRENRGRLRHCNGLQAPTMPLIERLGRRGRGQTRSQDIGLAVLVEGVLVRQALACLSETPNFSVKEKDETRLLNCLQWTC